MLLYHSNYKKLILYGIISLFILLSIGLGVYLYQKNDSSKNSTNLPETTDKPNPQLKNSTNVYTKLIPLSKEISDLKYFTDLSELQTIILSLMKQNFVTLTTDLDKSSDSKDKKLDFSKVLENNEIKPSFKPSYSLGLLKENPKDEKEQIHDIQGYENFYKLRDKISKKWIFKLKQNLKFSDEQVINNKLVIYSLQKQKEIMRALNQDEPNPSENIKLLLETNFIPDEKDQYTFVLSYEDEKNLYEVITLLNNCILFPKEKFELTYQNGTLEQSNYGTKEHPFVSYGPYELKKENGYNSEKDYILTKNEHFHEKEQYLIDKIVFKKINSSDEQQYNQEKYKLFNDGEINEIVIKDLEKEIKQINKPKLTNLLSLSTSDQLFVLFDKSNENSDDTEEIKKIKEKSDFFLKDSRFRKALFLALERNLLDKEEYLGLVPSFSFVSDVTLFTDYDFFNQQSFHQENLNNILSPSNNINNDNNQKFYQPETSRNLIKAVNSDFTSRFPENKEPLIFKIFNGYNSENDIKSRKKLTDFIINSWNKVFETITSLKIQFEAVTDGEANIEVGEGFFEFIKNPHNIFIYLFEQNKNENEKESNLVLLNNDNSVQNINIDELKTFLDQLQNKIDEKNNSQRANDLAKYIDFLKKLEKDAFEKLIVLPLVKGKKYKIYQNLENDFKNDFLLWGLNDFNE